MERGEKSRNDEEKGGKSFPERNDRNRKDFYIIPFARPWFAFCELASSIFPVSFVRLTHTHRTMSWGFCLPPFLPDLRYVHVFIILTHTKLLVLFCCHLHRSGRKKLVPNSYNIVFKREKRSLFQRRRVHFHIRVPYMTPDTCIQIKAAS